MSMHELRGFTVFVTHFEGRKGEMWVRTEVDDQGGGFSRGEIRLSEPVLRNEGFLNWLKNQFPPEEEPSLGELTDSGVIQAIRSDPRLLTPAR